MNAKTKSLKYLCSVACLAVINMEPALMKKEATLTIAFTFIPGYCDYSIFIIEGSLSMPMAFFMNSGFFRILDMEGLLIIS